MRVMQRDFSLFAQKSIGLPVFEDVVAPYFERSDQILFWVYLFMMFAFLVILIVSFALYMRNDAKYYVRMTGEVNSVRIYRFEVSKNVVTFFDLSDLRTQRKSSIQDFYSSFPGNDPKRVKAWVEDLLTGKKAPDYLPVSVYFHRSKMRIKAFLHVQKCDPSRSVLHLESYLLSERRIASPIGSFVNLSSAKEYGDALRASGGSGVTYCFSLAYRDAAGGKKKERIASTLAYHFRLAIEPFVKNGMKLIQGSDGEFIIGSFEDIDNAEAIAFALNAVNSVKMELSTFDTSKKPLAIRVGIVVNRDLFGDGDAIISSARYTADNAFEGTNEIAFFKRGAEDYSQTELTQYRNEVERIIYEKRLIYSYRPVYSASRKRIIGYLGKVEPFEDCVFANIDELKNYALRAKDDKNLFAAIAKSLVGTYTAERELKSHKLFYPLSCIELDSVPSFFKRLKGAKDANLVFTLDCDDISSYLSNFGPEALADGIGNVKEAGYGIAIVLRGKVLSVDPKFLSLSDFFFVDFSSNEDKAGLDTTIRSQLHALVEKLLKYKKPIIGTNLTTWNALELVVGSGIDIVSADVFAPYSPSLNAVNPKNETRVLALKGKL